MIYPLLNNIFREEDEFVMGGEDGYSGPSGSMGGGRGGRSGGKGRYGKVIQFPYFFTRLKIIFSKF